MSKKTEDKRDSSKNEKEAQKDMEVESDNNRQIKKTKGEDTKALKAKLKKSSTEIKQLKKELIDLNTEYLRQLADKENLRKRLEREKNEFYQHALSEVLLDLLEILDNFERALNSDVQDDNMTLRSGVEMIYKQLLSFLEKKGVKPILIEDKKFDPRFHQAFTTAPSPDVEEVQIDEEYQKGYTLFERLLRPALVKVLVPEKEKK